jgi:5-methylcytosine-specific restriction endonuclease McrA
MPKAYELPAPGEPFDPDFFKLGKLCKRNHIHADGMTLRHRTNRYCFLCQRIDDLERKRLLREDPDYNRKAATSIAERRKREGRPSRSSHGFTYRFLQDNEFNSSQASDVAALLANGWDIAQIKQQLALNAALRSIKPSPSVARLVHEQQLERWRQHPDERCKHFSEWGAYSYAFRYKCDSAFRRHECQRNSERKAKNRGNHTVRLNSKATAARFAQFDNSCAYCGSTAQLIVEHFIPRSKGGPHALGNILPACQPCNVSKRDHDPEQWYREQPFYINARWRKILAVLGKTKTSVHQLPFL